MVTRFAREARAAARLSHPHIVAAYDADRAGDTHFLILELVDGANLDQVLARRGQLDVARAWRSAPIRRCSSSCASRFRMCSNASVY